MIRLAAILFLMANFLPESMAAVQNKKVLELADSWYCLGHLVQESDQSSQKKDSCQSPMQCSAVAHQKLQKLVQFYHQSAQQLISSFPAKSKLSSKQKVEVMCELFNSVKVPLAPLNQNLEFPHENWQQFSTRIQWLSSIHKRFPNISLNELASLSEARLHKVDVLLTAGYERDIAKGNLAHTVDELYRRQRNIPPLDLKGKGWKFNSSTDLDLRGGVFADALATAFKRTGMGERDFEVSRWGKDRNGKPLALEYKAKKALIQIHWPSPGENGPAYPHIKFKNAEAKAGYILLEDIPLSRDSQ